MMNFRFDCGENESLELGTQITNVPAHCATNIITYKSKVKKNMARCVTFRSYRSLKAKVTQLKNFPFGVSTMIEVKNITTYDNTGTLVIQNVPR